MHRIGIDEKAFKKGHSYITLLYDWDNSTVEAISEGNHAEANVAPKDRTCSCCGDETPIIGTDVTERVDRVTAKLSFWEIRRHKRACGKCKDSVAQVPAGEEPGDLTSPVPVSDYGFGVYTQIIVGKFADHLPLYRGEDIFARAGMFIQRNTQFWMLAKLASLVSPLISLMKSRIVSGDVLGADDTSVRLHEVDRANPADS